MIWGYWVIDYLLCSLGDWAQFYFLLTLHGTLIHLFIHSCTRSFILFRFEGINYILCSILFIFDSTGHFHSSVYSSWRSFIHFRFEGIDYLLFSLGMELYSIYFWHHRALVIHPFTHLGVYSLTYSFIHSRFEVLTIYCAPWGLSSILFPSEATGQSHPSVSHSTFIHSLINSYFNFRFEGINYLLCSLGDGALFYFLLTPQGTLADKRKVGDISLIY